LVAADSGRDDAGEFVPWDFTVGQLRSGESADRFWGRAFGRELERGAYGPAAGAPELRRAVADYLRSSRGVRCRWEDVLIVQGTRQALDLIARVLLDPEDVVALEEPHYPDARHAFAARGAKFVAAPVDSAGLRVDELPEGPASAIYVTPSHHYPTGAVLSIERRYALLRWAARSGALVLEDDYDSEFRYGGRPIPALQGLDQDGRVIYLGSFSKVLSPDLRLGYVVASPPVALALVAAKRRADRQSPLFLQRAVATYMTEGSFSRHLWRMRARYGKRRRALVAELGRILPPAVEVTSGRAGIQLMLRVTDAPPAATSTLRQALLQRGVRLDAATDCYLGRAACAEFLLGFARHEADELAEPLRIIADVLTDFRGRGWRASDAPVERAGLPA
jgi:GntR family transcriptional regulator/MocR family aminotransferase